MKNGAPEIDTTLLRTLTVVAETRHFTQAAEKLNCVQSAVSMQIKRLEEIMQVRLFDRTNRQVKLTRDGEIALRYARRVLRLTDEAMAELGHEGVSGRVRLATTDMAICFVPAVLERFAQTHPLIEIELTCSLSRGALEARERGDADLAFVTQRCGRGGGKLVKKTPLVWVGAHHTDISKVTPLPLALFGPECIYRDAAIAALEEHAIPYRRAYESPSRSGLECAVKSGMALSVLPVENLGTELRDVSAGLPPLPEMKNYLFGLTAGRPPAVQAFAAAFTETLG
ncbi:MAG: LysR substrate-binding domain-containing protein [Hyphomicrobiaceae bacterium]|nr:LysR substrate-binding domain-containing protein [Hyphomicrobiaceae bacterium]